jgi:hypothetical protein
MTNRFLKKIDKLLETNRNMSLKILLEEDEKDPFSDAFGDEEGGDEEGGDEEEEDEESGDEEEDEESGDEEEEVNKEKEAIDTLADLKQNTQQLNIIDIESSRIKSKYKSNPEDSIKLAAGKVIKHNTIKSFIMLEQDTEDERENIESILNDYQDQIDSIEKKSYKNLKDKESGSLIDVALEVKNALNYIDNFDNHFKKSEIVYDWFVDKIADIAPANKKEETIKQFKEMLNQNLRPEDKIDIQEKPSSYNSMAGAKPSA